MQTEGYIALQDALPALPGQLSLRAISRSVPALRPGKSCSDLSGFDRSLYLLHSGTRGGIFLQRTGLLMSDLGLGYLPDLALSALDLDPFYASCLSHGTNLSNPDLKGCD